MDSLAAPGQPAHSHSHTHTYTARHTDSHVYGQFRSLVRILRIRHVLPPRLPEQSTFLIFKMAEDEEKE